MFRYNTPVSLPTHAPPREASAPNWLKRLLSIEAVDADVRTNIAAMGFSLAETLRVGPGPELRPLQAEMLGWAAMMGEGYMPATMLGVGHGKTLGGLIVGQLVSATRGRPLRVLYLAPPRLIKQVAQERDLWAKTYNLNPVEVRGEQDDVRHAARNKGKYLPLREGFTSLFAYSKLSSANFSRCLYDFAPDLIIADESHTLAGDSARAKRVLRFMMDYPDTMLIPMSGTAMSRKTNESSKLFMYALRDKSPLPTPEEAKAIDEVLAPDATPSANAVSRLDMLRHWSGDPRPYGEPLKESIRKGREALRKRLSTCPGVVLTVESSVDVGLFIGSYHPAMPDKVKEAIDGILKSWVMPDGTDLVDASEVSRHIKTLALGFYLPAQPGPTDWEDARSAWNKQLRTFLLYKAIPGIDTPFGVEQAIRKGKLVDRGMLAAWEAWQEVKTTWRPDERHAIWVDEDRAILKRIIADAKAMKGKTVLWTKSIAAGRELRRLGVAYHGAGSELPSGNDKLLCLSVSAYKEGWNGQPYQNAIVLEVPSGGGIWEQVLGRLHRQGQCNDVAYHVISTVPMHKNAFKKAISQALYVQQKTGQPQKMLAADWDYRGIERPRLTDIAHRNTGDGDE